MELNPIRLCLIKNAWYLIAQVENESEPRTYRIARFQTAEMSGLPASVPEDFDIGKYFGNAWAVYRGDQAYDIRIRFLSNAANTVTETNWHHTQQVVRQDDGSVVLEFQVDGLEEICNWLMPWAPNAIVEEPNEMRELLTEKLKRALKNQQTG